MDLDVPVTGYRYITHLYCLVVQAGFYSDTVECWTFVRSVTGSILGRVRTEDFFLHLLHSFLKTLVFGWRSWRPNQCGGPRKVI